MQERFILYCTQYVTDADGEVCLRVENLGFFDTRENALWRQIELKEEFIRVLQDEDIPGLYFHHPRMVRRAKDIINIFSPLPKHKARTQELITKFPVLSYDEYFIHKFNATVTCLT